MNGACGVNCKCMANQWLDADGPCSVLVPAQNGTNDIKQTVAGVDTRDD